MIKYGLEIVRQNLLPSPPPPPKMWGFLSYVLIPISKKHFQENPIFLQIKKILLIKKTQRLTYFCL